MIGLSRTPNAGYSTPAAIGMLAALNANEKNKFWRMLRITAWLSRRARTIPPRSPLTSVTAALYRHVGPGAHRDPDIRCGQSRCIVDAVARHSDSATLRAPFSDLRLLLIGQHVGQHYVDPADPAYDCLGRAFLADGGCHWLRLPRQRCRQTKDMSVAECCSRLVTVLMAPSALMIALVAAGWLLLLALTGALGAVAGGAIIARAMPRIAVWRALAMRLTTGIGRIVGTAV